MANQKDRTTSRAVDPVTFEIVKHKLTRVVDEAVTALKNCSGTAVTSEMHDLVVALYTPEGQLLVGGLGFLHHLTSAMASVRYIVEHFGDDPGIEEDDLFFHNDSYTGAMHAPDVFLISPVHWEGKLAGFVANFVHVADLGAIDPGGFCPSARSCFDEGFMSKGFKLVERGKLRKDLFETLLNQSRDPAMLALDLKSQMAANHTAKERLRKLYADYGFERVDAVGRRLLDESEQRLRRRLLELPDGTWRSRQYYDLPGDVRQIVLSATKEGDSLTFDFTGTSEQSPLAINCSYWAGLGAAIAPVFPLLAWDIFWNEGVTRPIRFVAPEGTLVHARRPAPVSLATVAVVQAVNNLAIVAISKMLGASEPYKDRPTALWAGAYQHFRYAGVGPSGEYLVAASTLAVAHGGGARAFADGVNGGGDIPNLVLRQANAETHELEFPLRELYRRVLPDSGGPGKYRGGVSMEAALISHGSPTNHMQLILVPGRSTLAPLCYGIFGGYPGCAVEDIIFRSGNAAELPPNRQALVGDREERIVWGVFELDGGDVLYGRWAGGGGYGDPLDRDPDLVLRDVLAGLVTDGPARAVYGVVVNHHTGTVDLDGTVEQRRALRSERLGRTPDVDTGVRQAVRPSGRRIGEYLQVAGVGEEAFVQCTWCGRGLCPASAPWKEHAARRKSSPAKAGPLRPENGLFFLREFFCPACGTLVDVEVVYQDDPPLQDEIVRWPAVNGQ